MRSMSYMAGVSCMRNNDVYVCVFASFIRKMTHQAIGGWSVLHLSASQQLPGTEPSMQSARKKHQESQNSSVINKYVWHCLTVFSKCRVQTVNESGTLTWKEKKSLYLRYTSNRSLLFQVTSTTNTCRNTKQTNKQLLYWRKTMLTSPTLAPVQLAMYTFNELPHPQLVLELEEG